MSRRERIQKLKNLKYNALSEKKDIETDKIICNWTGNCNGLRDTTNEIYDAIVIPFLHLEDALPNIKTFMGALKALKSIDNILPILKEWDIVNVGPCLNRNTCELNPTPSRYKNGLEGDRLEAIEKDELRSMKREGQEVICNKTRCSQFGMVDLCQHGIKHEWSESCTMVCEGYRDSYCTGA